LHHLAYLHHVFVKSIAERNHNRKVVEYMFLTSSNTFEKVNNIYNLVFNITASTPPQICPVFMSKSEKERRTLKD